MYVHVIDIFNSNIKYHDQFYFKSIIHSNLPRSKIIPNVKF